MPAIEVIICYVTVPFSLTAIVLWWRSTFGFPIKKKTDDAITGGSSRDAINLHVFKASPHCPSGSPLSVKVVLYARMCGIPHKVIDAMEGGECMSKNQQKGKVPVLEHAGAWVGDSQLIIRYLEETFDIETTSANAVTRFPGTSKFVPYDSLTAEQQATCTMVRLAFEEFLYWGLLSNRWLGAVGMSENEDNFTTTADKYFGSLPLFVRALLVPFYRAKMARDAWSQGLCRHSPADQLFLVKRAYRSLSTVLGQKPYFLGAFPSECDCVAFGFIYSVTAEKDTWPSPLVDFIFAECGNLVEYAERIRKLYFADFQPGDTIPKSMVEFPAISNTKKMR
jgi:glutathione S-transferase